jgi:hypothetical protein
MGCRLQRSQTVVGDVWFLTVREPCRFKGKFFKGNNSTMPMITIDDKEYDSDALSEDTKAQLTSMRLADAEIQRLNIQLAITQTARNAYALAVRKDLEAIDTKGKK